MTYTFKIARRLAGNHRRVLMLASVVALAGCTAGGNPILTEQPGAITLTINGLANGAAPQVTLAGPNGFQKSITHSGTVTGLALGSYEIVAAPSTAQSTTFTPSTDRQSVTLTGGAPTAAAAIQYQVATGALDVRIEGLPASTASAVRIEGPNGFSLDLASTAVLRGLVPGSYTLTAAERSSGGTTYFPTIPSVTVNVVASLTPAVAMIRFAQLTGSLVVEMTGLPAGATGNFILVGPGSYNASLTGAMELTALNPGQYVATVQPVQFDGHTWEPLQAIIPVTVDTTRRVLTIAYDIVTGALAIDVVGLPSGVEGQFTVTGPNGYNQAGHGSVEYKGLRPGTYTTTAASVEAGGRRFQPRKTSDNHDVTKGRDPRRGRIEYSESTGSLAMAISGLPSGVAGRVIVIGPSSVDTVVATGTLGGLAVGSYTVIGETVVGGGANYLATPASQVVSVGSSGAATAAVAYAMSAGALQVNVSGLPSGAAASIQVTGPDGFSRQLTGTTALDALVPGTYNIVAANVTVDGTSYVASPVNQTASVTSGGSASRAVSYAPATPTAGALSISVSGLPSGAAAALTVTGPGGFSQSVSSTTTLNSLLPGTYTIIAANVTVDGTSYVASPANQTASVTAGGSASRAVSYAPAAPTPGSLAITVSGLQGGTAAALTVTGPGGFSQAVTNTSTLNSLAPGTYTIVAANVTSGGNTYSPTPTSQTASVTAGNTASRSVSYAVAAPTTGSLSLTVSGLPGGTAGAITVTGPGGFNQAVTNTSTLNSLVPGTYTIAAANVTSGGNTYNPTPTSQTASVTAGNTASRSVSYAVAAPTTGSLSITVSGLPGGAAAALTVTGPGGFNQSVTGTSTLNTLTPGTYTIAAANVTSGGNTYNPTPTSQTASVTAGNTASRSVSYAVAAPTTGSLAITVSGLPGGANAALTVTGPGGFNQAVTGTGTLGTLVPGTYTIAAANVTSGGNTYNPTPTSQTASVTAGNTANRSVAYAVASAPATVQVDTTTRYQVIGGWEATAQVGQSDYASTPWANAVADRAANDLGINRIRLEVRAGAENTTDWFAQLRSGAITFDQYRPHRYETINDNSNPNSENSGRFFWTELDLAVEQVVLPLKQRVEANGEQLYVNLNYVGFTNQSGHVHSNPAEYAEFILATFRHLQSRYGLVPDGVEVILEPDNNTFWSASLVGQAVAAAGARLAAAGFHPDFIAPSVMNMGNAPSWFDQMAAQPGALTYLDEIAYHRYTGVSNSNLQAIAQRAAAHNLQTAMLEHIGSGVEDLYKDLTIANVSSWQQFAMAYPAASTSNDNGGVYYLIINGQPVEASRTKQLRQYFKYVRTGARRVAATSTSGNLRPVAFLNPGGGMAVVIHVDGTGSYTVGGLRPGNYQVTLTTGSGTLVNLPGVSAVPGGTVSISPNQTGILTLSRVP